VIGPQYQPPVAGAAIGFEQTAEFEADSEPLRRYFFRIDLPAHAPDEFLRVKIIGPEETLSPALPPCAQQFDNRTKILAGCGQPVEMALAAGFRLDMNDARLLKLFEPLSQHRPRYRWCCREQFSERARTKTQLPYDDRRPAVGKDLGGLGNGTELRSRGHGTVILHCAFRISTYSVLTAQVRIPYLKNTSCLADKGKHAHRSSKPLREIHHERINACRYKSTMLLRSLRRRRRKVAFASMNGSEIHGLCCSRIQRTLHRYARPSSATWRESNRNSTSAASK